MFSSTSCRILGDSFLNLCSRFLFQKRNVPSSFSLKQPCVLAADDLCVLLLVIPAPILLLTVRSAVVDFRLDVMHLRMLTTCS